MRILIWTDAFWPDIGGLEVFCMRLATALKERGHRCLVIAERRFPKDEGLSHYHEIPVHGVSFCETGGRGNLAALRRQHDFCAGLLAEFDPDIIHLNSVIRGALGFVLQQRQQRRPAVLTLHDHFHFPEQKGLGSAVLENVDAVVAVSRSVERDALRYEPKLQGRLRTIHNALPIPELSPSIFPKHSRLLSFGRLVKDKGFDLSIRAFVRIATDFPEVTLTIAGEGTEMASLKNLAEHSGFASRIFFPGWVAPSAIPALINQHSIVIVPSRWQEPFGLVALEAAQMGRPVVASRSGGIPEVVQDGTTGQLFDNDNLENLVEKLVFLLTSPAQVKKLGRQARLHVESAFRFASFVSDYESLYKTALK